MSIGTPSGQVAERTAASGGPSASGRRRAATARSRGPLALIWTIVCWIVIAAVVAVLLAAVVVPRVAGATPYTILTGSMSPEHPAGSLVIVKPTPTDEIGIGDVITYQLASGESTVVTHRVVAVTSNTVTGEKQFVTQGDANQSPDTDPVQPVQVRGVLWYDLPYLGHANSWLTGNQRQLAVYAVGGALAAYALWMLVGSAADRRRRTSAARRHRGTM